MKREAEKTTGRPADYLITAPGYPGALEIRIQTPKKRKKRRSKD